MPMAWPASGDNTRKCLLTRFSYLVIYTPLPGYWRERLPESR